MTSTNTQQIERITPASAVENMRDFQSQLQSLANILRFVAYPEMDATGVIGPPDIASYEYDVEGMAGLNFDPEFITGDGGMIAKMYASLGADGKIGKLAAIAEELEETKRHYEDQKATVEKFLNEQEKTILLKDEEIAGLQATVYAMEMDKANTYVMRNEQTKELMVRIENLNIEIRNNRAHNEADVVDYNDNKFIVAYQLNQAQEHQEAEDLSEALRLVENAKNRESNAAMQMEIEDELAARAKADADQQEALVVKKTRRSKPSWMSENVIQGHDDMVIKTLQEDLAAAGAGGGNVHEQVISSKTIRIDNAGALPLRVTTLQSGVIVGKDAGDMKETVVRTAYTTDNQSSAATNSASARLIGHLAQANATTTFQSPYMVTYHQTDNDFC